MNAMGNAIVDRSSPEPQGNAKSARVGAGFTMAELLVAMLILAIVLTGLAALQLGTIRNVTDSQRYAAATRLAEGVLSRYQALAFTALPNPLPTPEWDVVVGRNGKNLRNVGVDGESRGPYTVHQLVENDPGGRRLITVRVTWLQSGVSTGDGGVGSVRLSSVLMTIKRAQ
jgi:prepilin-type N-terminal cleavage/methylation domain-containing protein